MPPAAGNSRGRRELAWQRGPLPGTQSEQYRNARVFLLASSRSRGYSREFRPGALYCKSMPGRRSGGIRSAVLVDSCAARAAAVKLLARRDYASADLRSRLRDSGFDAESSDQVIATLEAQGILNDARYAQNYVAYHAGRGQGPLRIATELRRKGVPGALIEAALAEGPDWGALARRLRAARFGAPPSSWPEKARQARFLQYRGFSSDHIRAATGADLDLD
jgi:regulatory protein